MPGHNVQPSSDLNSIKTLWNDLKQVVGAWKTLQFGHKKETILEGRVDQNVFTAKFKTHCQFS